MAEEGGAKQPEEWQCDLLIPCGSTCGFVISQPGEDQRIPCEHLSKVHLCPLHTPGPYRTCPETLTEPSAPSNLLPNWRHTPIYI